MFSLQGLSVMNFHRGFLNLPSRLVMILLVCIRVGNRALCPKMCHVARVFRWKGYGLANKETDVLRGLLGCSASHSFCRGLC